MLKRVMFTRATTIAVIDAFVNARATHVRAGVSPARRCLRDGGGQPAYMTL